MAKIKHNRRTIRNMKIFYLQELIYFGARAISFRRAYYNITDFYRSMPIDYNKYYLEYKARLLKDFDISCRTLKHYKLRLNALENEKTKQS